MWHRAVGIDAALTTLGRGRLTARAPNNRTAQEFGLLVLRLLLETLAPAGRGTFSAVRTVGAQCRVLRPRTLAIDRLEARFRGGRDRRHRLG